MRPNGSFPTQPPLKLPTSGRHTVIQTRVCRHLHLGGRTRVNPRLDAANRHSKTIFNDPDEGSKITYLHNALGQRVFKSEPQVDHVAPSASALGQPFIDWLLVEYGNVAVWPQPQSPDRARRQRVWPLPKPHGRRHAEISRVVSGGDGGSDPLNLISLAI